MEYQEMAKYYDLFYKKKNYDKESTFLENLINKRKTILDVGCGTGLHMHYLEEKKLSSRRFRFKWRNARSGQNKSQGPSLSRKFIRF